MAEPATLVFEMENDGHRTWIYADAGGIKVECAAGALLMMDWGTWLLVNVFSLDMSDQTNRWRIWMEAVGGTTGGRSNMNEPIRHECPMCQGTHGCSLPIGHPGDHVCLDLDDAEDPICHRWAPGADGDFNALDLVPRREEPIIALAMVGRSTVSFEVTTQWIRALRERYWPGPTFLMPEIYAAGAWIGVVPLRNLVTHHALADSSWTHLLWIDADHRVHHHLFDRVQVHARAGLELVCGPYYSRSYPFEVQAFSEAVEGGVRFVPPTWLVPAFNAMTAGRYPAPELRAAGVPWKPAVSGGPLIEVAGAGTGCMLVRRDVLERMAEKRGGAGNVWRVDRVPWEEQLKLLEAGEFISGVMTEDIMFCLDVKELLGVQCWLDLDPRMETGHMGEMPVDRRQYLAAHQVVIPPGVDPASVLPKGYELVSEDGRHFGPVPVDTQGRVLNTTRERERNKRRQ